MEENSKFTIIDEFDKEKEADIITVIESNDKKYLVYSLDTDEENCDVLVSRLIEHEDGTDSIEDIDDDNEREQIHKLVDELLNT